MVDVVRLRSRETGIVVEEGTPTAAPDFGSRIRQQEILTELGVLALKGTPFSELLDFCAKMTAEGLGAEFCKVLEYMPSEGRFLVKAGVGWGPGVIGIATVGADLASPAGYALKTGKAVISNHLENEDRFRTPELLLEHGIRRAMNVILQGDGTPFGVLEVDSRSEGEFSVNDITFLQGVANLLGMAIERQRLETRLTRSLERHQILLKEVHHRVNNSLQLVSTMLELQSQASHSAEVQTQLHEASGRIVAIARAHRRLYKTENFEALDLTSYLTDLCIDLDAANPNCTITVTGDEGIAVVLDKAIPIALLVNELITNAAKYAYPAGEGDVLVNVRKVPGDGVLVSVRDKGVGLPQDFKIAPGAGLGMRIAIALESQLNARLSFQHRNPGAEFILELTQAVARAI